jgi:SAM-dependent methyltransferase
MGSNTARVFQKICGEKAKPSQEAVSCTESELRNAAHIIRELPGLLRRYGVRSILDVPCGDFGWMRHVDLSGVDYTGADIVPELIAANQSAWAAPTRRFIQRDLLRDKLPDADLVLCRDCLSNFSHMDVLRALERIADTASRFLLTTTFVYRTYPRNADIATGQWTPINLEMAPYDLGSPLALLIAGSHACINYGPDVGTVPMSDCCLGLWDMESIRTRVRRRVSEVRDET